MGNSGKRTYIGGRSYGRWSIWTPLMLLALLFVLPQVMAQQPRRTAPKAPPKIAPVIPGADRHQPGKVFLEHADILELEQENPDFQTLRGNVQFRKGDMFMYCDSAHFYESTNSLNAYSNIRLQQGDTLFVYADELSYDGLSEIARLYAFAGKKVRMINRDVKLETDMFDYDLAANVGYYQFGGVLSDRHNRMTSREGYYYPGNKNAFFYHDVELTGPRRNDTVRMYTDSLQYNTGTSLAWLLCPTLIVNKDGEIRTTNGIYDTRRELADLYSRSLVVTRRGTTLCGDTLFYDRQKGFGEALGNMVLVDSAKQSTLTGDYGYYNEITDSAFVTGRALVREYSRKDTIYTHADTLIMVTLPDSTHVTRAFHNARFFRIDLQGLADSVVFSQADSTLRLFRHPVVWADERQIFGNLIEVHFNDSTADMVNLPQFGMMVEHIDEDCYDQLSGSKMTAWLNDTTLTRLYVEGNVRVLLFPMENDSSYNKFTRVESSFLDAYFVDNEIDRVNLWPETNGTVTPLYLAKRGSYFLPDFQWYDALRPRWPADVFVVTEEQRELMTSPEVGGRRRQ